ncbi:MAG: DUF349 domain-containing protein [Gammaproteobacteria bacterium]|nr:DUF349 domain-containing protein [Gammaproteobacteria bacterium]
MGELTHSHTSRALGSSESMDVEKISWGLLDTEEKISVLTKLTLNGQHNDYINILAGIEDAGIAVERLLTITANLPGKIQKQIALKTKSRIIAEALVASIESDDTLADLTLYAKSVHSRKNAVQAIDDKEILAQLQEQIGGRDKTVTKILASKLNLKLGKKANTSKTKAEQIDESQLQAGHDKEGNETAKVKRSTNKKSLNPKTEIPIIEDELEKLSFKNTARLINLKSRVTDLHKLTKKNSSDLEIRARAILDTLATKIEQNQSHQEALKQSTATLLVNLQKALDVGQSHDALTTWDKIQGNISNTSGKLKSVLQGQTNEYRLKLNELRDWKVFAATDKKNKLIQQMQNLLESKMHAPDKAKHIGSMHKEWKTLGRSNQNEELWRKFKEISDKAYEPCKAYFKDRKRLMSENLKARREICASLETAMTAAEKEPFNISLVNKLLQSSEHDWKKYAPVEQSKVKTLQKRFYNVVNQLRRLRKNVMRDNGRKKQLFIAEAIKLVELEDESKAMNEAKRLQKEWKTLGPTSYKEDQIYWEKFRTTCDKIFVKKNKEVVEARVSAGKAQAILIGILSSLADIIKLDDEGFRSSQSNFNDLEQAFATTLNPKIRKQHKRLLDEFNNLKSKIDTRFKALPNKKQLAIRNAILEKATFLKSLEDILFTSNDSSQFNELKSKLEYSAWSKLTSSHKPNLETALQNRFDALHQIESAKDLQLLAIDCEQKFRSLCIELEIRANIDTPQEDQPVRMQIQLDQLKNGFGQAKPDRSEHARYALDAVLLAHCIGPLEKQTQSNLMSRLEQAVKKLL